MRVRRSIRAKKSPRARKTLLAKRSPRAKSSVREKPGKVTALTPMVVAKTPVAPMDDLPATRSSGAWAFMLVMVFLSAAAMLSAALRSGELAEGPDPTATDSASAGSLSMRPESLSMTTARPEEPAQLKPASKKIEPAKRVEPATAQPVAHAAREVAIQPAAIALGHIAPLTVEPAASMVPGSAEQNTAAVTITGCLELDADTYRLKDASGESAPKARSWKTGFLRKRSATIAVTDTANRLALSSHVGHLITLTGTLVDREMQARALQRVAPSCDRNA